MNTLDVGNKAPDFELPSHTGGTISLSGYLGKTVILAFYPEDTSLVCTKELCSYNKYLSDFNNLNVQVLGINTDSIDSHKKFAKKENITFPLLSDEGGKVSKSYGALYPIVHKCKRGVYIIDENGIVRYKYFEITPLTYRKPKELLGKLEKFKNAA